VEAAYYPQTSKQTYDSILYYHPEDHHLIGTHCGSLKTCMFMSCMLNNVCAESPRIASQDQVCLNIVAYIVFLFSSGTHLLFVLQATTTLQSVQHLDG